MESSSSSSSGKRPFTVIVEGNIGSGKSTFLSHFRSVVEAIVKENNAGDDEKQDSVPAVEVLSEPVDKWRDLNGHNLLQLMYSQPDRWSLAFQSYVQLTMVRNHLRRSRSPIKMLERSLHSGRHCFIENLYRSGKLPGSEYSVLDAWFNFLTADLGSEKGSKFDMGVDLVVYLRTTPQVAWQRVKQRARSEEDLIPIEYLQELHDLHEDWLMREDRKHLLPARVLVLDADEDIYERPDVFSDHCARIFDLSKGAAPAKAVKQVDLSQDQQKQKQQQQRRIVPQAKSPLAEVNR